MGFVSLKKGSGDGSMMTELYADQRPTGGVAQLTKALANEWSKDGVCVNAIAPGYIETDM